MRLIWKTTLISAVLVFATFVVTAIAMMYVLPHVMDEEIDEHLLQLSDRAVRQIERRQQPKDAIVRRLGPGSGAAPKNEFRDITLQEDGSGEAEPFRELRTTRSVRDTVYEITVRASRLESEDLSDALLLVFLFAAGVLIVASIAVHGIVARRMWKPFYRNLDILRRFSVRDESPPRWSISSTREFRQMSAALDELTTRVRREYTTLKGFTENASHELQTPLSVLRTKLDRLRQDLPPDNEAAEAVASMDAVVKRLTRLNRNLLLLARLDNRQYDMGPEADIRALVSRQLDSVAELFDAAGLRLDTRLAHDLRLAVNPHLFEILLANLLTNALRYTSAGGTVHVVLDAHALRMENPGRDPGIPGEELFERFRKTGEKAEATGLGLAIVREIAAFHGWSTGYRYADGIHAVTVTFDL